MEFPGRVNQHVWSFSGFFSKFWVAGWVGGGGVRNISLSPCVRDAVLKPYFPSHLADIWGVLNNMNYVLRNKLLTPLEFLQEHFNPDPQDHPRSLFLAHFPQCKQTWVLIVIKHTVWRCREWGEGCGKATMTVTALCAIHLFHLHSRISALSAAAPLLSTRRCFILKGVDFKSPSNISSFHLSVGV